MSRFDAYLNEIRVEHAHGMLAELSMDTITIIGGVSAATVTS